MDSKRTADEDEPESKEEVMDENCLGRWRRGWSGGNMSSSSALSAAHAQRLIIAQASFLLDVCASKLCSENRANFNLSTLGRLARDGCAVAVPIPRKPLFGSLYVISPPTKLSYLHPLLEVEVSP